MQRKTKYRIIVAAAVVAIALCVALGAKLSKTPTPGEATPEEYARELQARGAAKGSTPADLAKFLVSPKP